MPMRMHDKQDDRLLQRARAVLSNFRSRVSRERGHVPFGLAEVHAMVVRCQVCHYCRNPLPLSAMSLDHMTPRSRGGSDELFNVVLCCTNCNERKSALTAAEFRELLALIGKWHPVAQADIRRRLRTRPVWK